MTEDRQLFEFICPQSGGGCGRVFEVKLNVSLNGNHRIHCPICLHIHYRVVKNGEITEERFPDREKDILAEDVWPMKSACKTYEEDFSKYEDRLGKVFLSEAWRRTASVIGKSKV